MSEHSRHATSKARLDIPAFDAPSVHRLSELLNDRIAQIRRAAIRSQTFPTLPSITQADELEMRIADRLIFGPMDPSWRDELSKQQQGSQEVLTKILRDIYDCIYEQWHDWARAYATNPRTFERDFKEAWQRVATIISEFHAS